MTDSPPASTAANQPEPESSPYSEIIVYPPAQPSRLNDLDAALANAIRAKIESGDLSVLDKLIEIREQQFEHQKWVDRETMTHRYELAKQRENRKDGAAIAAKNNLRLIIASFMVAFISAMGYGAIAKDASLADKVLTGALGVLAGSGGAVILGRKSEEPSQKTLPPNDES